MFRFFFGSPFDDNNRRQDDPFSNTNDGFEGTGIDSIFQHFDSNIQNQMEDIHQQMQDVMRSLGSIEYTQIPSFDSEEANPSKSLRDEMLKDSNLPAVSPPDFSSRSLPQIVAPFTTPNQNEDSEKKMDSDIDDKTSVIVKELEDLDIKPSPKGSSSFSFSRSNKVTVRTVQKTGGNFEHWRTVEDSSGRKEEVYTKVADGQKHTITRKVDSVGNEEETEEIQNLGDPYEDQFESTPSEPQSDVDQSKDQLYNPYQQGISSIRYYLSNLFGLKRD